MGYVGWDDVKEKNGLIRIKEIGDIKIYDILLFEEDTEEWSQGHQVVDIFYPPEDPENITVEYIPEWTEVRNSSMFKYGKKNYRHKE